MARKRQGWLPLQHGAWAMLLVTSLVGVTLRARQGDLPAWVAPFGVLWLFGYLCFNAATLWLKAAPVRRRDYVLPVLVYGTISGLAGLMTLLLGGWHLLWWLPLFVPLLIAALVLAVGRKERSIASGLATIIAVSLAIPLLRFDTPQSIWQRWDDATRTDLLIALAVFCYFFGTVVHVKAMIRERLQRHSLIRSVAWHLGCLITVIALATPGLVSWWWAPVFALAALRAWWMPDQAARGRSFSALKIGVTEIVLSALLTGVALAG